MKNIFIIFLFIPILTLGQININEINNDFKSQIKEQLVCNIDRNLYLSGDDVYFSALLLINNGITPEYLSEVLYVELFDRTTKVIARAKFPVIGNLSYGSMKVPAETLSGAYFLRFYTKYQRNQSADQYVVIPLTIVNTELTLPSSDKNKSINKNAGSLSGSLVLTTDNTKYNCRSKVILDLAFPEGFDGFYCISAARHRTLNSNIHQSSQVGETWNDSVFFIPDVRGVSLSGFVKDNQTDIPLQGVPVFMTAFGNNKLLHISETKPNGSFLFALNKMEGNANVFVTIDPTSNTNIEVLINNDFSNKFSGLPDHYFNIDTSYRDLLTNMLVDFETQKSFTVDDQNHDRLPHSVINLPNTYDFSIRVDDFIELASLQEVFYEIVPPVSVKSDKGKKHLTVANYQTQQVSRAALITLDDVPVFDVDELLKISPANIESIQVINKPYYLGDYLLSSIISLKTKTGDFGGYKFPKQSIFLDYQGLSENLLMNTQEYFSPESLKNPHPDFRTTLYWQPYTEIKQSDTSLLFFTSDAKGKYDIVVSAISKSGELIYGKASIVVE